MVNKQHIILYSSSQCSRCSLVKQMLDNHNVKYTISEDKQLMLDKELLEIPALEINGKIIDEYSLVLHWLRENNYYSLWEDDKNDSQKA